MTCPQPVRWFLLLGALCLPTASAIAQTAKVAQSEDSESAYRIAGTVVSKTDGHPLASARVTIRDVKNSQKFQSMITSEDGKFEFGRLPAGKYSLEGAKRGFVSAGYDQHEQFSTAIVTGAGVDTESLLLKLAPDAVITGKVLDEAGEPVRRASVTLYYDSHQQGVDLIHAFRRSQTDDLGAYEIAALIPGTYFVSANAKPWYAVHPNSDVIRSEPGRSTAPPTMIDRSLDVAYPTTYYADVTEAESATPIPVRGGERVQVDIHLNPVPALRVTFRLPGDDKNGFIFPQLEQSAFDDSVFVQANGGRMISPGVFEITGIPAGRYNIRLRGPGTGLQMNGVDLSKEEELDTTTAEAFGAIKVSAQMPDAATLPPQLLIALRSGSRTTISPQRLDAKGEAEFQEVPAGHYEVLAFGPGKRYSISHMAAEGAEASGHSLTVTPGASASVSLTLVAGSAEIHGTAKRAGKGFAGAMVVLVPDNPEGNRDLFRRDQSDLDGTFSFYGVIPGSYTVVAIDNGWDLDWSLPGVIAAYAKGGQKIEVGNRAQPTHLAEAVGVQSK